MRGAVTLGRQAGQASSCHLTSGARATTGYQMLLFVCLVFLRTARSAPPSPVAWALRRPLARRAHGLCRAHGPYRAHGLLGLLGPPRLQALERGPLTEPGGPRESMPKPSPRSRQLGGHLHVARTWRGPSSCECLVRGLWPVPPRRQPRPRGCRHAPQESLCPRCTCIERC